MVFAGVWKPLRWSIKGNQIEQVKNFWYLGIYFNHRASWAPYRKEMIKSTNCNLSVFTRFYFTKGNQFVPAAIKVFTHKIRLLCVVPISILALNKDVERIQSSFLQKILGLPTCVPYADICTETNQRLLETRAWIIIKFRLHLNFKRDNNSLIAHLLM